MSHEHAGPSAWLRGVGLWTLGHPSFAAWVAAGMPEQFDPAPDATPGKPSADLLHPRLRRRTSLLTRMIVTALAEAAQQGGAAHEQTRYIVVSSWGEIETTVELLGQLAIPGGPISPTAFHNSVHNTATGYLSIASGNHWPSTALAAGPHALEIGLLEACAGLRSLEGPGDALLILAEERLPAPFDRVDADPSFALALHLARTPGRASHASSLDRRIELSSQPREAAELSVGDRLPSLVRSLRPLLRAIHEGSSAAIPLLEQLDAPPNAEGVEHVWTARLHSP
ncbi:beta-ketoacyl synthase chain length factor [Nannocystaceae bacterium ST9]